LAFRATGVSLRAATFRDPTRLGEGVFGFESNPGGDDANMMR
jgi:hypothetical protein